jgi:hypothetical protein
MSLRTLSMTTLLTLGVAVAASASELSDEPCINGGVSADGSDIYATSEARRAVAERERIARLKAFQERLALEMEPCINGGVSASGTHVSQSIEDTARYFADGTVYSTDPNYVFMIGGRIIAPAYLVQR